MLEDVGAGHVTHLDVEPEGVPRSWRQVRDVQGDLIAGLVVVDQSHLVINGKLVVQIAVGDSVAPRFSVEGA